MPTEFILKRCLYCQENMVSEEVDVCSDCLKEYDFDVVIGDALLSLAALKKYSKSFTSTRAHFEDIKFISSEYIDLVDEIDAYIKFKE